MNTKQILLRVFSGILALVCILCLVLDGIGVKQALDCKSYWEQVGADANESFNKLEDGINQLRDNEDAYLTGVDAYADGLEEYEQGEKDLAEGEEKLSEGQAQYDDGAARLAAAHKQYDENIAKLNASKAELEAGKARLEDAKAQLAAGEAELESHRQEYEEGKAKLAQVTPIYEAAMAAVNRINALKAERERAAAEGNTVRVAQLDLEIRLAEQALNTQLGGYSINGIIAEYEAGQAKIAEFEEGERKVEEGRKQIAEGEEKIAASEAKIAEAEKKLAEAKATLDEKDQQLANAGEKLAAGYADYEEGKEKLAAGAEQLKEGLARLGEYEGGQDQVAEGLDMVLGTDTYYNAAKQPLLLSIRQRLDPDFTYWKLDENGEPLVVNEHKFLSLMESLKVVRAGREFLDNTSELVTSELLGRLGITALAAFAVILGLLGAILGLCGRRVGALVCAVLALLSSLGTVALSQVLGRENPLSAIAGTGNVGIVLIGVQALIVSSALVAVFAALPGSGRVKKAEAAPAEAPAET